MKPEDKTTAQERARGRKARFPGSPARKGKSITRELYERMFKAYVRNPSISRLSETLGIAYSTAKKAVDEGWPERGFEAIRDRFARVVQEAQRRESNDPATVLGENLGLVRKIKGRLRDAAMDPDISNAELMRISNELDRVLTREHALLQSAIDAGVAGGGSLEDQIAGLDDADLEALATEGEIPAELFSYFAPGYRPETDPDSGGYVPPSGDDAPKGVAPPPMPDLPDLLASTSEPLPSQPSSAPVTQAAPVGSGDPLDLDRLAAGVLNDAPGGSA